MDILGIIFNGCVVVYQLVDGAKANQDACKHLAGRVKTIETALRTMQQDQPQRVKSLGTPLAHLESTLNSAIEFLHDHNKSNKFFLIVNTGSIRETFEDINQRLTENQQDLSLPVEIVRAEEMGKLMSITSETNEQIGSLVAEFHSQRQDNQELKQQNQLLIESLVALKSAFEDGKAVNVAASPNSPGNAPKLRPYWQIEYDDIDFELNKKGTMRKTLGDGGSAQVFAAKWQGKDVAVKVFRDSDVDTVLSLYKQEVALMCRLQHRNIVRFHGATLKDLMLGNDDETEYCVVMQRGKMSLRRAAHAGDEYFETGLDGKISVLVQIAEAIMYLHRSQSPIVHRDLKLENVLMDDNKKPFLIDFGMAHAKMSTFHGFTRQQNRASNRGSKNMEQMQEKTVFGYTESYAAPEVLRDQRPSSEPSQDVYSFGCMMFELMNDGELCWPLGTDCFETVAKNEKVHEHFTFSEEQNACVPESIQSLIHQCTQFDPKERPTIADVFIGLLACKEQTPTFSYISFPSPTEPTDEQQQKRSSPTTRRSHDEATIPTSQNAEPEVVKTEIVRATSSSQPVTRHHEVSGDMTTMVSSSATGPVEKLPAVAEKPLEAVRNALQSQKINSISAAFSELRKVVAVDATLLQSVRQAPEVKDLMSKVGAFLNESAESEAQDVAALRDACVAVGTEAVSFSHKLCANDVAFAIEKSAAKSDKNKAVFGTAHVRSLLLRLGYAAVEEESGDYITSTATALRVLLRHAENKTLFGTEEVRDALVAMGKTGAEAKHAGAIHAVAGAIINMTTDNGNKLLFGAARVRTALISMAHASVGLDHGDAIRLTAGAITNIVFNTENADLFCTPEMRDTLAAMGTKVSELGDSEGIEWAGDTIATLTATEEHQKLFGTEEIRAALVAMANGAAKLKFAGAIVNTARAMRNVLRNDENEKLFGTEDVRDALVGLGNAGAELRDAVSIQWTSSAISNITSCEANKPLFGTYDVRRTLVAMASRAVKQKHGLAVRTTANAFHNVMCTQENQQLFSTDDVLESLVDMGKTAAELRRGDAVCWSAAAMAKITCQNEQHKKLFSTPEVRGLLVSMGRAAAEQKHGDAIHWTAGTMTNIQFNDSSAKELYGREDVRDALVMMAKGAVELKHPDAILSTVCVFMNITVNDANKKLFGTKEVRAALTAIGDAAVEIQHGVGIEWAVLAINNLTVDDDNRRLFDTEEVRDALQRMQQSEAASRECKKKVSEIVERTSGASAPSGGSKMKRFFGSLF